LKGPARLSYRLAKMRESMARLTPEFSASRTVRQYAGNYYLPAAKAYAERSKDNGSAAAAIVNWQRQVAEHWPRLRLDDLRVDSGADRHVFHVRAYLDELDTAAVRVELYADGLAIRGRPSRFPFTGENSDRSVLSSAKRFKPAE